MKINSISAKSRAGEQLQLQGKQGAGRTGWNKARTAGLNVHPLVKGRTKTTFSAAPHSGLAFSEAQHLPWHHYQHFSSPRLPGKWSPLPSGVYCLRFENRGEKPNQFRPKPHSTEVILRDLLPNFRAQHHWNRGLLPIHSLQVTLKVV